jgi:DNA-directed RNA polymerase III subunit RPC8
MFYLSRLEHTFRMPPSLLSLPGEEAVKGELERLFLDKVSSMVFSSHCFSYWDQSTIVR